MKPSFVAAVVLFAGLALSAQTPSPQQAPVFRGGTIVVPLTVTVVDEKGAPVKDLTAADFTITENKSPREILAFFPQELKAEPVPPGDVTPVRAKEPGIKPQTGRTFLIVLGYGRIEYPTRALEGAIDLVKRLLPQDAVAVMAFHRTTVFTRDHERIAQVLERYRKDHEKIVLDINNYRSMARAPIVVSPGAGGVSAPPGNTPIPDKILKRIDQIFLGSSAPSGSANSSFIRNTGDLLMGMDRVIPVKERPGQHQETFGAITRTLRDRGESFTDEVLLNTKLKLYAGVEYLRAFEGEKQMVFFSGLEGGGTLSGSNYRPNGRGGTYLQATNADSKVGALLDAADAENGVSRDGMARNVDEAKVIAQRASDARVVVNLIATNGTGPRSSGDPMGRVVTEDTGGYYTSLEMASKAVAKVDDLTRFSYLLGYSPSNPELDGTFRDVDVKVNRPGLTVRFRHGYFAAPEPPPLELEKLVKKARVETALAFDQEAKDIPLQVSLSQQPRMGIQSQTRVEITIDAGPLAFELKDGLRTGQLEIQVYCGDAKQNVIGEEALRVDLRADDATYQQWLAGGIRRSIRVATTDVPKFVKVIVYDYGSDRIGSTMITIK